MHEPFAGLMTLASATVTSVVFLLLSFPSQRSQQFCCAHEPIGSLSTRVFETRTATGREHFVFQDSGVSHIFILIICNGEKILSNGNVVV